MVLGGAFALLVRVIGVAGPEADVCGGSFKNAGHCVIYALSGGQFGSAPPPGGGGE
jgi:hypothetical protein